MTPEHGRPHVCQECGAPVTGWSITQEYEDAMFNGMLGHEPGVHRMLIGRRETWEPCGHPRP